MSHELVLERIASALERIVHLMETEPINVKIPNLHPSVTAPTVQDLKIPDLTDDEADAFHKAVEDET